MRLCLLAKDIKSEYNFEYFTQNVFKSAKIHKNGLFLPISQEILSFVKNGNFRERDENFIVKHTKYLKF